MARSIEPQTLPHRTLAGDDSRFARFGGVDVHHRVTDMATGMPVVLLHHFYGSVATWRHVFAALANEACLLAHDRPGFGLTERLPRSRWPRAGSPYTRAASASITLELMDAAGIDKAVLVGASSGGTSALETYALAPDRVRALVLVAPAIIGDVGPPDAVRPLMRTPVGRFVGGRIIRRFAGPIDRDRISRSWYDPSRATDADVEAYAKPLRVDDWARGLWEVFAAEGAPKLASLLSHIEVPTLVVSGDSDPVVSPTSSRRTAAAIPGADYLEIPHCGHTPHEERPDQFVALLRDFLAAIENTDGRSPA